jgi:O-antigen/teichoic acid export membrane protein
MSQTSVSTAGVLVQGLSRFGYTILIGRFMGKEDLAHVSALLALALVFSLFWPTGAGNAASHFLASSRARGRSPVPALRVIGRSFWISMAVIVLVGVPCAVLVLDVPLSDGVVFAAFVVAYSGYILSRGVEVGLGRFTRAALWDLISAASAILVLAAVLIAHATTLLLWPLVISYSIFTVNTALRGHRGHSSLDPSPSFSTATILRFSFVNSIGLLASNGLIQLSMVWVFALERTSDAGVFAAAMSLATPASMLSQAISQALIPRFSAWAAVDRSNVRRRYLQVLAVLTVFFVAVFGVVWAASPLIIRIIYGEPYTSATPIMQLLLVGVCAFSIGLVANAFLITSGRALITTVISAVGFVFGLVVTALLSSFQAPGIGAALGVVAGYVVAAVGLVGWSITAPLPAAEGLRPEDDAGVALRGP